jgi:hypothetical protein
LELSRQINALKPSQSVSHKDFTEYKVSQKGGGAEGEEE